MAWGSSQEATAVLVAVNYFQKHGIKITTAGTESHSVVAEAGERSSNRTERCFLCVSNMIIF